MKHFLFRADDLGYSEAVNYGVEKAVKEGVINNVGVMVNMPATAHGVKLLINENISFGLHTNICVGRPLSNLSDIPSLTTENGCFKPSKIYRQAEIDFVEYDEVLLEIDAQYKEFLRLFGRKPDYFEGHAVASSNFFLAMEAFAQKHGLTYSGLPKNMQPNGIEGDAFIYVNDTKVYLTMESMKPMYDPYQMLRDVISADRQDGIELLVFHPGYLDYYLCEHSSLLKPRIIEVEMLTNPTTQKMLHEHRIKLVEYKDL